MFDIVSAVIINRNRKWDLEECLDSIHNQTYKVIETIVVDNNSTDNSISDIRLPYNMGVTLPTNIGVASSVGKYILLVDNDAILDKNFVQNALDIFEYHPTIGVIAGRVYKHGTKEDFDFESYGTDLPPYMSNYVGTFCATACMIRRDLWDAIGGYNQRYFAYYQEPDFAARAMKAGYDILYEPSCICWHKFTPHSRDNATMLYFLTRNHFLFVWEHLPLPYALFQSVKWVAWSFIKGRHHPYTILRAYLGVIELIPHSLKDRKALWEQRFIRPWSKLFRHV